MSGGVRIFEAEARRCGHLGKRFPTCWINDISSDHILSSIRENGRLVSPDAEYRCQIALGGRVADFDDLFADRKNGGGCRPGLHEDVS